MHVAADYGVEKAVSVQGLDQTGVTGKLQDLVKHGEALPRCVLNTDAWYCSTLANSTRLCSLQASCHDASSPATLHVLVSASTRSYAVAMLQCLAQLQCIFYPYILIQHAEHLQTCMICALS